MKLHAAASLLLLLAVPSCDKAKDLLSKAKAAAPKPAAAASAPPRSPSEKRPVDFRIIDSTASHDEFIKTPGPLVVTHFHSRDCPLSTQLCPMLDLMGATYYGRLKIGRIDVDDVPDLTKRERINTYPRWRLYRDGKLLEEIPGLPAFTDVQALFKKYMADIPVPETPPPPPVAETPAPAAEPAIQPMKKNWLPPGIERR